MDPDLAAASPTSPPAAELTDSDATLPSPDLSMLSRTGQSQKSAKTMSDFEISDITENARTSASRASSLGATADYVSNVDSADDIVQEKHDDTLVSDVDERHSTSSGASVTHESHPDPSNLSPLQAAAPLAKRRVDRARRCARVLRVRFRAETRRVDRAEGCARVFASIFAPKDAAPTARNAARAFLRTFSSRKAPRRPRQTLRAGEKVTFSLC